MNLRKDHYRQSMRMLTNNLGCVIMLHWAIDKYICVRYLAFINLFLVRYSYIEWQQILYVRRLCQRWIFWLLQRWRTRQNVKMYYELQNLVSHWLFERNFYLHNFVKRYANLIFRYLLLHNTLFVFVVIHKFSGDEWIYFTRILSILYQ